MKAARVLLAALALLLIVACASVSRQLAAPADACCAQQLLKPVQQQTLLFERHAVSTSRGSMAACSPAAGCRFATPVVCEQRRRAAARLAPSAGVMLAHAALPQVRPDELAPTANLLLAGQAQACLRPGPGRAHLDLPRPVWRHLQVQLLRAGGLPEGPALRRPGRHGLLRRLVLPGLLLRQVLSRRNCAGALHHLTLPPRNAPTQRASACTASQPAMHRP